MLNIILKQLKFFDIFFKGINF